MTQKDCLTLVSVRSHKDWTLWPLMAGPAHGAEPTGLRSMESLLHCIFSNPKNTFNFIKKRMKSDLAAGQLAVCVNFFLCAVIPPGAGALSLGEVLLTGPQPQGSGTSGLRWVGLLFQRPQRGVQESRPGSHVQGVDTDSLLTSQSS